MSCPHPVARYMYLFSTPHISNLIATALETTRIKRTPILRHRSLALSLNRPKVVSCRLIPLTLVYVSALGQHTQNSYVSIVISSRMSMDVKSASAGTVRKWSRRY